ncbi:hypothetical protein EYF80_026008 [Liparis tanakae]|uniref:Uncharacterized protein n=1 Tax=Liparis tanakae TaxID=230148 RepID=A0A4Z2HDM3_9TELE|nr:hypothetical protein EYF80_026008 [Liparis tanakae]
MEMMPMVLIITMDTYTLGKTAITAVPKEGDKEGDTRSSSGGIFSMESHSSRTVVSTWTQPAGSDSPHPKRHTQHTRELESSCTVGEFLLTSPSSLSVSPLEEVVFPLRCRFLCRCLLLCLASTSHRSFMLRDGLMR